MKTLLASIMTTCVAGTAIAGGNYSSITPDSGSNGDINAVLILLLLVGAVVATGGFQQTDRAKSQDTDSSDDDIIMRF